MRYRIDATHVSHGLRLTGYWSRKRERTSLQHTTGSEIGHLNPEARLVDFQLSIGGAGFAGLFLVKVVYADFFPLFLCYLLNRTGRSQVRIRRAVLFMCRLAVLSLG